MRITIFFKNSKCKQVINTAETFLFSDRKDKKGNRTLLSSFELSSKVKELALHIAGGSLLDVSYDMPKYGEY